MKINDKVLVHIQNRNYEISRLSIGKIIGETKTSWRVEYGDNLGNPKTLFLKSNLHMRGADQFSCTKLKEWDNEVWDDYKDELFRRTVIRSLTNYKWGEIDTNTLKKIHTMATMATMATKAKKKT